MSRMKTKGRTIPVQLPLALDAWVREQAKDVGVSPGIWLTWWVTKSMPRTRVTITQPMDA